MFSLSSEISPPRAQKKERRNTEPDEKGDQRRFKLTIRMMLGVRVAVGRQSNPLTHQNGEVTAEEYAQVGERIRSGQVRSDQIRSDQIRSDQIR